MPRSINWKEGRNMTITFPAEILSDSRLSPTDRMLLAVITAFDNRMGCYLANRSLAYIANCSMSKVSQSVSKLVKMGYITSNRKFYKDGTIASVNVRTVKMSLKRHKR